MTNLTAGQIKNVAIESGWTGDDLNIAVAVCLAESGGNPNAKHTNTNGSVDIGLWQVNSIHGFDPNAMLHTLDNGKAAHQIWVASGWKAWTTFNTGAYLMFMPEAKAAKPTVSPSGDVTGLPPKLDTINPLTSPLTDITSIIAQAGKWMSNAHNWERIALVVVGIGFVLAGLTVIAGPEAQKTYATFSKSGNSSGTPPVVPV
jgi:hypothetical protein